jgi:hypothetical protein
MPSGSLPLVWRDGDLAASMVLGYASLAGDRSMGMRPDCESAGHIYGRLLPVTAVGPYPLHLSWDGKATGKATGKGPPGNAVPALTVVLRSVPAGGPAVSLASPMVLLPLEGHASPPSTSALNTRMARKRLAAQLVSLAVNGGSHRALYNLAELIRDKSIAPTLAGELWQVSTREAYHAQGLAKLYADAALALNLIRRPGQTLRRCRPCPKPD